MQGDVEISTDISNTTGLSRSVNPDNNVFYLRDTATGVQWTASAQVTCTDDGVWTGGRCVEAALPLQ
jgi:hypothetical protein